MYAPNDRTTKVLLLPHLSHMPSKFEEITVVAGYLGSELISLLPDAARNLEKGWRHMVRDAST
jgi:hypothetical protein